VTDVQDALLGCGSFLTIQHPAPKSKVKNQISSKQNFFGTSRRSEGDEREENFQQKIILFPKKF